MKLLKINWKPDRRTLSQFGFISLALFGLLGVSVLWKHALLGIQLGPATRPVAFSLWGLGLISGVSSLVAPEVNRFLYVGLVVVTYPIGFLLSYLLMGLIFYVILTPVGLVFRLIGRDALHRRFDRKAGSYWVPHREPAKIDQYFRQF